MNYIQTGIPNYIKPQKAATLVKKNLKVAKAFGIDSSQKIVNEISMISDRPDMKALIKQLPKESAEKKSLAYHMVKAELVPYEERHCFEGCLDDPLTGEIMSSW